MRIATSTIYAQQTAAIDNQAALYADIGAQLSSGKQLNAPSDNPGQIGQDLQLHVTIDTTTQQSTNVKNAVSELTSTDSALSSLTSVLQSARTLAVQGASDTLTPAQRTALGNQIDELLQQSIAVGNTQYAGKFIFAGTSTTANPPVVQQGNPISGVTFTGNEQVQGQLIYNNQQFALSTTFQSAFNYASSDGSPDVFQTLIRLRDTLQNDVVVDQSTAAINRAGAVVYGAASPAPTRLNAANVFATTPVPDGSGNFSLKITGSVNGVPSAQTITVAANAPVDGPGSVVAAINAVTAQTGVTAVYDPVAQKMSLNGTGSFFVQDVPSAGAATAGNLSAVLNLASTSSSSQADMVQNVSTQIANVDHILDTVLNARSVVGARIQTLSSIGDQLQTTITDNTKVESGIEDVNVAAATSKFSQTQTALQAAYATTNRLEAKTLFDYLT
ncbi:MAG TPA: flagellar hook-associated protein FlgL [Candidatus Elarobacter sp.]|jgi:flagellar hook-associated protein 3 FlgL|nr:flagellar hook-associated protein FlgL [Candidatus Elarobacter sp.]